MKLRMITPLILVVLIAACSGEKKQESAKDKIDRYALVTRHNVVIDEIDTLGSLSVGNGQFAYTVDITGLQTFSEYYENGMALGTQSQWAWHRVPNEDGYELNDVAVIYESCNDHNPPYAIQHKEGRERTAANYLRANPHRLHLGIIGLLITDDKGNEISIDDIQPERQELDLWTGTITSEFSVDGTPVMVTTYGHQDKDQMSAKVESDLIESGRLKVRMKFPYGKECHVCPGYDWDSPEKHTTEVIEQTAESATLERKLDATTYYVAASWTDGNIENTANHEYVIAPSSESNNFEFSVAFSEDSSEGTATFADTENSSKQEYESFWKSGGAIDFSRVDDPRAKEIERRVVLSQYLTKIQCTGQYPPQETGLTMNSWYGKFHLEMHWWHGAHFGQWGRVELLEPSMSWYFDVLDEAKAFAKWQGYEGARWMKMTDPWGAESPSSVGAFIIWQQPHPIYFAEQFYQSNPSEATLNKYKEIVFSTAEFLSSFAQYSDEDGKYHLCHPIIPAQEIFHATKTNNPPFEVAYWYFGLKTAQKWRERLGMEPNAEWQKVIDNIAPVPSNDDYYLPAEYAKGAYTNPENRRDHPMVVGTYGLIPADELVDKAKMAATFDEVMSEWNWLTTWGWDYPMLAMAATRLGKPEDAVKALLLDLQKNTYLVNGHNYQDKRLRLYLPGNGGVLSAVALMAAGWEGSDKKNPGFPADWDVRWEGLNPML